MSTIKVKLKKQLDHSYNVLIKDGLHTNIAPQINKLKLGQKYAIITDSKVKKLYGKVIQKQLPQSQVFSFTQGEKNKTLNTVEKLATQMLKAGFTRNDAIIALGGGVTGDIAGLLSAIYMRGIPFIQIPTTLLAMVDSSVGGKTGVDLEDGKNLLGTFTQPKAVLIDPQFLQTLAKNQLRSGLAEVIKYGIIKDKNLFEYIENNLQDILDLKPQTLEKIIKRSVEIKAQIVEEDEKESEVRMLLNYGHTYGHALEKNSNYTLLHGYAIAIGMTIANEIAQEKAGLTTEDAERIRQLLKAAKLPTTTIKKPSKKDLRTDKKHQGDHLKFIVPTKIGHAKIISLPC